MHENEIGTIVVDCAVHLHRALDPGLLESVYEATLARQLERRGLSVQWHVMVPGEFEGDSFDMPSAFLAMGVVPRSHELKEVTPDGRGIKGRGFCMPASSSIAFVQAHQIF